MSKPIILVVDDDPDVLQELGRDLRSEYAARFRILSADSGQLALEATRDLKSRPGSAIALFLVDQKMPGISGTEFLKQAIPLFPEARRVLLTAYADTQVAIDAINLLKIDHYLLKPWTPAEDRLFPILDDVLDSWRPANPSPMEEWIHVVGHRWSPLAFEVKDFLQRNQIPYRWIDVETAKETDPHIERSRLAPDRLPYIVFPDGSIVEKPRPSELAEKLGLKRHAEKPSYEFAIIGGGPAGLAAAVYASSEGLRSVLIEKEAPGGQAGTTSRIENYLGFPAGLTGADLARRAVSQAKRFGTELLTSISAQRITLNGPYKVLHLSDDTQISCQALLLATGVDYRKLEVPGAAQLVGRGIYYGTIGLEASYCEGETAVVVGGGNSAGQAALYLAEYARQVLILVRGNALADTMSRYLIDRLQGTGNILIRFNSEIVAVAGDDRIRSIRIKNTLTSEIDEMSVVSMFVYIGARPGTEWLDGIVERDRHGFLLTGPDLPRSEGGKPKGWALPRDPFLLETNVPGIFAAGDVRHSSIKRIASAVGEGAIAVTFTHQYLSKL